MDLSKACCSRSSPLQSLTVLIEPSRSDANPTASPAATQCVQLQALVHRGGGLRRGGCGGGLRRRAAAAAAEGCGRRAGPDRAQIEQTWTAA